MLLLRLLLLIAFAAALPIDKRFDWASLFGLDDGTVTATTTVAAAAAATTVAAEVTTAAAVAATTTLAAAATTTATSTGGFWSSLLSMFDSTSSSSTTTAAAAASTTAASTSSSSGWLSSLLSLFGSSSSSSTTATTASTAATAATAATSASSATETPGFSGLVVVGTAAASTATAATSGSALTSDISAVAQYAELGAGITYSPYTKSGDCKTASEVKLDIEMLSDYGIIRLYSVDCLGIENVVAAISLSQKLFLGVWDITALSTDLPSMATQVLTGLRGWDAVHTVAIGNEVVDSGRGTVAEVTSAMTTARAWFKANASDYSGYIVAVDTLSITLLDTLLCDISDYIAVNCHPYFAGVEASTSGTWLESQVASLKLACGNSKNILITESGWPTYGDTVGSAVPSVANQLLAIESLGKTMGDNVIMFTTYNDYWKDPGLYNVEQHWGIYGDPEY